MTHDLVWAERVKSEYKELSGRILRLDAFLYDHAKGCPVIDKQDILLLQAQLDVMKSYARILIARLHYHNIEINTCEIVLKHDLESAF